MLKSFVLLVSTMLLAGIAAAQEATPPAITPITATAYGTINVRSGPGAQYEIVGQLDANARVMVDGRDNARGGWLRVMLESGVPGWVASFAVLLEGDSETLPVIDTTPPAPDGEAVMIAAYGRVNVRSGPGMEFALVGQLDVDDTAQVTGRSNSDNDWLYIETDDLTGWVAYFTVTIQGNPDSLPLLVMDGTGEGLASPEEVVAARFNVRLRDQAGINGEVLVIVPFESNVAPLARSANSIWVYVLYQDVYGWGAARLFDLSAERIASLPVYTELPLATPSPEATANPDAEG